MPTAKQYRESRDTDKAQELDRAKRKGETENAILDALPDDFAFRMIHPNPLYGVAGSIAIGDTFYAYSADNPDAEAVASMLDRFRPISQSLIRDSCVSFRAPQGIPDELHDKSGVNIDDAGPFLIELDGHLFDGRLTIAPAKVTWIHELAPNLLVDFDVVLRPGSAPWSLCASDVKQDRSGLTKSVGAWSVRCQGNAYIDKFIQYAGGDHRCKGKRVLYWPSTWDFDAESAGEFFRTVAGI